MLPWLIAVLLVLNLGLFWWGQYHQVPIDPELPPLPAAAYSIELLDRAGEEEAQTASAPSPAADGLTAAPEPDAAKSDATPPVPQTPSEAAATRRSSQYRKRCGRGARHRSDRRRDGAPCRGPGWRGRAGSDARGRGPGARGHRRGGRRRSGRRTCTPKVVKKRKVKRRKPAKPVEPFLDF